jgi:hypothetical protein
MVIKGALAEPERHKIRKTTTEAFKINICYQGFENHHNNTTI